MDVVRAGNVVQFSLWQPDTSALQERAHAVEARLAMDQVVVVPVQVEVRNGKAVSALLDALAHEAVERVAPCCGVHPCAPGEDAVEVEETCARTKRQPELPRRRRRRRQGAAVVDMLLAGNRLEEVL